MQFDVFFSISQTPVDGVLPSERRMFENFLAEVEAADRLGFGTAWVAEAHLSTEVQKRGPHPVIPHWEGEVGLNTDILLLAQQVFARTSRIEVGSAIANLLVNGGPIAHAERVAAFATLHGLDPAEHRRVHYGFAAGRFEFMARAHGIVPRDDLEAAAWPALKGRIFAEAAHIFLRLLRGDVLSSDDIPPTVLTADDFRRPEDWAAVRALAGGRDAVPIPNRWTFDALQIVPRDWRRELIQPVLGSHDPALQTAVNAILPVHVFNLSITRPEVIEATHARMREAFHPDGGPWRRSYMPRTTFVFLDADRDVAQRRARVALSAYWKALEGTIDPAKVERAADNALVGTPQDVADQLRQRFHPDDRLMLWFDFFEHDPQRVIGDMTRFVEEVSPRIEEAR